MTLFIISYFFYTDNSLTFFSYNTYMLCELFLFSDNNILLYFSEQWKQSSSFCVISHQQQPRDEASVKSPAPVLHVSNSWTRESWIRDWRGNDQFVRKLPHHHQLHPCPRCQCSRLSLQTAERGVSGWNIVSSVAQGWHGHLGQWYLGQEEGNLEHSFYFIATNSIT